MLFLNIKSEILIKWTCKIISRVFTKIYFIFFFPFLKKMIYLLISYYYLRKIVNFN